MTFSAKLAATAAKYCTCLQSSFIFPKKRLLQSERGCWNTKADDRLKRHARHAHAHLSFLLLPACRLLPAHGYSQGHLPPQSGPPRQPQELTSWVFLATITQSLCPWARSRDLRPASEPSLYLHGNLVRDHFWYA